MSDEIQYGVGKAPGPNGQGDSYNIAVKELTRGEAIEMLTVIRRLALYRTAMIDTDIVENAMRAMAEFEVSNTR